MSNGLLLNGKDQLQETRTGNYPQQPGVIRLIAKIISYIFHPAFVPVYIIAFMLYLHPYFFAGFGTWDKTRVMLMTILMFAFFPIITVLLLKALDFIKTIQLNSQKDRIIPLAACMIWYFWITYVWWSSHKIRGSFTIPKEAVQLALAIFIASILTWMINIKMKISLHAIAMGVMLAFFFSLAFTDPLNYGIYIAVTLLIAGLVCTSRFIISDHTAKEVYGGLAVGIASQLIAAVFV